MEGPLHCRPAGVAEATPELWASASCASSLGSGWAWATPEVPSSPDTPCFSGRSSAMEEWPLSSALGRPSSWWHHMATLVTSL